MANYNPDELLKKIQMAKQQGIPDAVINQRVKMQFGVDTSQLAPTPGLQKAEQNWLVGPAVKFGGTTLEAVRKLALLTNKDYRESAFGDPNKLTPEQQAKVAEMDRPRFISKHQEEITRAKPLQTAAKNAAGAASYVIPAGKTFKGALALGGTMGGLRAFSEENATPASVIGGTAGGAIAGGLIYGAGKGIQKGKEIFGRAKTSVGKMATQEYLKTTPTQWANAMREHGINPNEVVNKYIPGGMGYDDALDLIKGQIKTAEGQIQSTANIAGNNIRISGNDVLKALAGESKILKSQLGSETKVRALDKIVEQATAKYKNGITVKQAVKLLHDANSKFGASIIDTGGDAVATSAQKLEANTIRRVLKNMFPDIADSLRIEEELLTLRPIVEMARAKAATAGFPNSLTELFKEKISPPLASKFRGAGQVPAVPNTPAELSTVVKAGRSSLQPGFMDLNANVAGGASPVDDLVSQKNVLVGQFKELQKRFLAGESDEPLRAYQVKLNDLVSKINFLDEKISFMVPPAPPPPITPYAMTSGKMGVSPGIRTAFDQAMFNQNWDEVSRLAPQMPKEYVAKFANRFPPIMAKTIPGMISPEPGLNYTAPIIKYGKNVSDSPIRGMQPGSVDLGYVSDVLKSGPPATPPTLTGGLTQLGALAGARIVGGDGGVPSTPSGLGAGTGVSGPTSNAGDQARLAQLMLKYPKYATEIKNAYDVAHGGSAGGGNITKVTAQNYSNSLSGFNSLGQVNSLIFNASGAPDTVTLAALKTPGTPSWKARQLKAHLYNVADSYLRLRTGAQANPDEIRRLADSFTPGVTDNAETIKTKLGIYDKVFRYYIELATKGGVQDVPENPQGLYSP